MRLAGKVAIVTGGASGFGEGIARKFVAEGANVVIADHNSKAAQAVAASLGEHARSLHADVTRKADVAAMLAAAQHHFGGLDISSTTQVSAICRSRSKKWTKRHSTPSRPST